MQVDDGDLPYKEIDSTRESRTGLFTFLTNSSLTLNDSLAEMVKQSWWFNVYIHAGAPRNARAWNYWNKIDSGVKDKLAYRVYASFNSNDVSKQNFNLDTELQTYSGVGDTKGLGVDVSDLRVYFADGNLVVKADDSGTIIASTDSGNTVHHVTYAPDGFLYVTTAAPAVEKWDPISLQRIQQFTSLPEEPYFANYEPSGKIYLVSSTYIVKMDASAFTKDTQTQLSTGNTADLTVDGTYIYFSNGSDLEKRDQTSIGTTDSTLAITVPTDASFAFMTNNKLIVPTTTPGIAKVDVSTMSLDKEATADVPSSTPKKVCVTPDQSVFVGFANGTLRRYNSDLTAPTDGSSNFYEVSKASEVTGIAYAIE